MGLGAEVALAGERDHCRLTNPLSFGPHGARKRAQLGWERGSAVAEPGLSPCPSLRSYGLARPALAEGLPRSPSPSWAHHRAPAQHAEDMKMGLGPPWSGGPPAESRHSCCSCTPRAPGTQALLPSKALFSCGPGASWPYPPRQRHGSWNHQPLLITTHGPFPWKGSSSLGLSLTIGWLPTPAWPRHCHQSFHLCHCLATVTLTLAFTHEEPEQGLGLKLSASGWQGPRRRPGHPE